MSQVIAWEIVILIWKRQRFIYLFSTPKYDESFFEGFRTRKTKLTSKVDYFSRSEVWRDKKMIGIFFDDDLIFLEWSMLV